jgi:hypothetical protein
MHASPRAIKRYCRRIKQQIGEGSSMRSKRALNFIMARWRNYEKLIGPLLGIRG